MLILHHTGACCVTSGCECDCGPFEGTPQTASYAIIHALTWSTNGCRHHNDRVKKLITEPGNPNLIISAAEDSSGLASPLLLSFGMQSDKSAPGRMSCLSDINAGLSMPCCTTRGFSWEAASTKQ